MNSRSSSKYVRPMKGHINHQLHHNNSSVLAQVCNRARRLRKKTPARLLLLALYVLCSSAPATTVRFKSSQVTVSIPPGFSGSPCFPNLVTVSGLNSNVTLSVSGAPTGATPALSSTSIGANTTITVTLNCTNVAGGLYPMSINGTDGATNTWPFFLEAASIWTGDTNLTTSWSSSSSWAGGNIPGATSEVLFGQSGAQTNVLVNGLFFSNSVVDQDFEVASLRFAPTNSAARFHTLFINP